MYRIKWYRTTFVREAYQADKVLSKFDWILIFYLLCLFTSQIQRYWVFQVHYLRKGEIQKGVIFFKYHTCFSKDKKNQNGPVEEKETFKCC